MSKKNTYFDGSQGENQMINKKNLVDVTAIEEVVGDKRKGTTLLATDMEPKKTKASGETAGSQPDMASLNKMKMMVWNCRGLGGP